MLTLNPSRPRELPVVSRFAARSTSNLNVPVDATKATLNMAVQENAALRRRLRSLEEDAFGICLRFSLNGEVVYLSPRTRGLLGLGGSSATPGTLEDLFHPMQAYGVAEAFALTCSTGLPQTLQANWPLGTETSFEFTTSLTGSSRGEDQVLLTGQDITEFKATESKLVHRTMHDALTGLPNRLLMQDRIEREIGVHARCGKGFAVMALDLDGFKRANDSLGHAAGDDVLREVSLRIQELLRDTDTVARMGGDEFVLVLQGVETSQAAELVARRVLAAIRRPFQVQGHTVYLTTSIGTALYPADAGGIEMLLSNADLAMYEAKQLGKDRMQLFQEHFRDQAGKTVSLEAALYDGVRNGEFLLHFQPICDAATGHVAGVEGLMRWRRPEHGLVSPLEFIPLAESNGLINILGAWALKRALMELARWDALGGSPIYASVNVSPRQFRHAPFLSEVRKALEMSGVHPSRLVLEITEGVLMQDPESAQRLLEELVQMGVRISVDDFGTGYSSLAYIQKFPLYSLKIDKAFIDNLPERKGNAAIVDAVLALARGMDLKVVAEGVEERVQKDYLAARGCDFVQGWLTGRPVAGTELDERLPRERLETNLFEKKTP